MIFGFFIFFVAVVISAVAEYYSIMGLTAIFAAAFWPVVVMGVALGVGKITAAIWLKLYWDRAKWTYKLYLVPAIVFLMFLTSMGIFGFLSKAHSDLGLETSNIAAQISVYDEKIKIANSNIEANRKALTQLDDAVDQILGRSSTEQGAIRSVKIRNSQQKERKQLISDIAAEQEIINQLTIERAKIAVQIREVEAEVGPIKYIAALIYGSNPNTELLESAVRWVIILIVLVFDPLALCLMLAAQQSIRWGREERKQQKLLEAQLAAEKAIQDQLMLERIKAEQLQASQIKESLEVNAAEIPVVSVPVAETSQVPVEETVVDQDQINEEKQIAEFFENGKELAKLIDSGNGVLPVESIQSTNLVEVDVQPSNPIDTVVTNIYEDVLPTAAEETVKETVMPITPADTVTVTVADETTAVAQPKVIVQQPPEAVAPKAKEIIQVPETLDRSATTIKPVADNADMPAGNDVKAHFGIAFPASPEKGELFLRVDYLPARLFKFNASKWIEVNKSMTDSYVYNTEYIKFMIKEIDAGRLDPDDLSPSEREQIAEFLANDEQSSNTP